MTEQDTGSAYLTLPEIAERYRTTEAVIRYWRHTGYGPAAVKVGRRLLYPRAEVERFDRELQAARGGELTTTCTGGQTAL